ncbi:MAG: hypothetical protein A2268_06775 [Candidatus Raymondbacteria bacterium RifOxyA12_full_50_37]|nr:MAG: hypothetical protein A2268_06775 [Candidatus Raymondbacteria bacterium RifOxyA12_full_50_37]OGJ88798.1 MAG: hypothetical protein A2248_08355 [Candidatus Raymondbacteria bacterium RIFOXYA2_FULL_49_16]OGJ96557.1 MAG: hypothetical protein A2453_03320 [Candidatus Raymondbacteria bacterium RIFOXYC2_FULL_50_21]OGJ99157.1 MAG: hypothetical protein A2487_10275 [Candidatus Raymondbacteria bacterium RifOxyC12_full_50_8]OGK04439.1 MAG: hypothetical protein A2350_17095 [Candidatus Raymondbacteria b
MKRQISRSKLCKTVVLISEKVPGVKSISLGFWINRGSRFEAREEMGLSHLYEHMIFKGTRSRSARDIARVLEQSGGNLNAFTGKEQICIHAKFVDEELPCAADVIKDMFLNPVFDTEELTKEKNVVLEEIRGSQDNPEEYVQDSFMQCLWPRHPLGFPIAGRSETVQTLDRDDLLSMQQRAFSSKIVIAAAGNVNHASLRSLFRELGRLPRFRLSTPRAQLHPVRRMLFDKEILQANVSMGFRICSYHSEDKYAFLVLNALLGDGMSSRLFQNIRERLGLVYSIYSFMDFFIDSGVFGVFFGTEPHQMRQAAEKALQEIRELVGGGVTDGELNFAKTYIKGNILLGMENTTNRMSQLARSELFTGAVEDMDIALSKIQAVSRSDLKRIGQRYITPKNLSMAVAMRKPARFKRFVEEVRFALA